MTNFKPFSIFTFQIVVYTIAMLMFLGCKEEAAKIEEPKDPVLEEIAGDYYQELIRTPVNADGTVDTTDVPKIYFEKDIHHFGTLNQEDKQKHRFTFENKGNRNLVLLDVKTSCGCTVASYDEEPIKPGEKGAINIEYDPKNRKGLQEKKIIVTSNAFPNKTELTIIADVIYED